MTQASPASTGVVTLVDVVAIEAEPGFQPQAVAGAEPGGLHLRLVEQQPGQPVGLPAGTEISNPSSPV